MAYLDLGAAWLRADWPAAWNPYWSPLYAWLVAGAEAAVAPGPLGLAELIHAVNFGAFLFALWAFRFLLNRLDQPGWAWRCAGYALFLEATLGRISLARTTPDLLLAALLFLAAGLALERRAFALGCALGAAYLTKAAALPLAPVFVLAAGWRPRFVGRSLAGFALAAGWWIVGLSWTLGVPTFGNSGKLNYAWNVLGVERPYSDRVERISDQPPAYAFGEALEVTYPLHYAPGFWRPELALWWDAEKQWDRLRRSLLKTAGLLLGPHWLLLCGLWLGGNGSLTVPARLLLLPALAGLALYQPVFVAERYVAVFIALFWLGCLASTRPRGPAFAVCALAFLTAVVVRVRPEPPVGPPPGVIAQALLDAGLPAGARVAAIWPGPPYLWARPAGVRIVAESRDPSAPPDALIGSFAAAGAEWAVAPCEIPPSPNWRSVVGTGLCLAPLQSTRWASTADPRN